MGTREEIRVLAEPGTTKCLNEAEVRSLIVGCLRANAGSVIRSQPVDLDDLVQDTLLALWRRQSATGSPFSPAYVRRTARNVVIDRFRRWNAEKRGPNRTTELLGTMEMCDGRHSAEDHLLESASLRSLLSTIRGSLGPQMARVLWLSYVVGMTAGEIAALVGGSRSGVNSTLHRARRRLRGLRAGGLSSGRSHSDPGRPGES